MISNEANQALAREMLAVQAAAAGAATSSEPISPKALVTTRQAAALVVESVVLAEADGRGFINPPNTPPQYQDQCVALVKVVTHTENIPTGSWTVIAGTTITTSTIPNLPRGTPIATFDANGRYPANGTLSNGRTAHAAIFLGYDKDPATGAITGLWVLDQYVRGSEKKAGVSLWPIENDRAFAAIQF